MKYIFSSGKINPLYEYIGGKINMAILRAIGRFFAKIGRWIRDTAWVQPLLIVGAIFALIFSIPQIVNGIKKASASNGEEYVRFYNSYSYSLTDAEKGKSKVDKLFADIKSGEAKTTVGEKFFLTFVKKDCSVCESQYEGWKYLKSNWGKGEFSDLKGQTFKMVTVFIDKEKKIDDEYKNLFKFVWSSNTYLFENFTENYEKSEFAQYKEYTSGCTSFANLYDSDDEGNFKIESPTTLFFDYSNSKWSWDGNSVEGLSEIMFSFPGDNQVDKARTLHDCWNHAGVFADHNYYND